MNMLSIILLFLMILSPVTSASSGGVVGTASVVDGDTIEIHGQRIRLHGIDAPESRQICMKNKSAWRCGKAAAFALSDFIGRSPVTCLKRSLDRYKRVVAVCSVRAVNINAWLVSEGWAVDWPRYSKYAYATYQKSAKTNKKGVWASIFKMPWKWRRSRTK